MPPPSGRDVLSDRYGAAAATTMLIFLVACCLFSRADQKIADRDVPPNSRDVDWLIAREPLHFARARDGDRCCGDGSAADGREVFYSGGRHFCPVGRRYQLVHGQDKTWKSDSKAAVFLESTKKQPSTLSIVPLGTGLCNGEDAD